MSRRRAGGMTVVTCDAGKSCPAEFRSASDADLVDEQLEVAGWETVKMRGGNAHRCPMHVRHAPEAKLRAPRVVADADDRQADLFAAPGSGLHDE